MTDTPPTPQARSLSGPVTLTLDFLDAIQFQVAIERRLYALREQQGTVARARAILGIDELSEDERLLDGAIGQCERAAAALEAAMYAAAGR